MAGFDPISNIAAVANTVLSRVLPDKPAQEAAQAELGKMALSGELSQVAGQIQVNNTEAASASIFVAGWRPFVGWVCGVGLAYNFVLCPLLTFASGLLGSLLSHFGMGNTSTLLLSLKAPSIDMSSLSVLLTGMLGLGAMRSYEKVQGVSCNTKDTGH